MAFFGTPHEGASIARWGTILANIVKISSLGTISNAKLAKNLESQSGILLEISKAFVDRGHDLDFIYSFFETKNMAPMNCLVSNVPLVKRHFRLSNTSNYTGCRRILSHLKAS